MARVNRPLGQASAGWRELSRFILAKHPQLQAGGAHLDYNPRPPKMWTNGRTVNQAQLELELKLWKELALSKQILMLTATEALNLPPESTQQELKHALDAALKKIAEADTNVLTAREEAKQAIAAMETKLAASQQAQVISEATMVGLQQQQQRAAAQMTAERAAMAKEVEQLKERLAEKEKTLKSINAALADTPENVLKKMRALKKEKQDEADARRRVEASLAEMRKEKREQDQKVKDSRENGGKLATRYRELHATSQKLHEQLKSLVTDEKDQPAALPEFEEKLLAAMEDSDEAGRRKDGRQVEEKMAGGNSRAAFPSSNGVHALS
jgi:colicin import membrane protein